MFREQKLLQECALERIALLEGKVKRLESVEATTTTTMESQCNGNESYMSESESERESTRTTHQVQHVPKAKQDANQVDEELLLKAENLFLHRATRLLLAFVASEVSEITTSCWAR